MSDAVVLTAYDSRWPEAFAEARAQLQAILVPPPLLIEHMGSTAVPGLDAKPVIDIIVLAAAIEPVHQTLPALAALGYEFRPDVSSTVRLFLRRMAPDGTRTHHLHIHSDREDVERHLLFRDLLRNDASLRHAYLALKAELATWHRDDREAYSKGKDAFVDAAVRSAGGPARRPFWNS